MLRHVALMTTAVIALFLPSIASAQDYGPDYRVTSGTLENGVNYLIMPLDQPADAQPRGAAIRLLIDAGLLHESESEFGAADVAAEIARARAGAGATVSVHGDHIVIGADLASTDTLASRLGQLASVVAGQPIAADALAPAKAAAAQRLSTATPEQRIHAQAMRRLLPTSREARRPAGGMPDVVRALSVDAVNAFARRWYVPSNVTVVVAAPGAAADLQAMVQAAFGPLPRVPKPASPATMAAGWTPPADPIVIEDPDLTSAIVGIVSARPWRPSLGIREFRSSVVQRIGLDVLESLVQTRITKAKVPFTSASAERTPAADGLAWTFFHVTGDPTAWRSVVTEAINEVNRIRLHGLDRVDVSDALVELAGAWGDQAQEEDAAPATELADLLGEYRGAPSARQRLDLLLKMIASIPPDDVEWEFSKQFDPATSAIVLALPARPGVPSPSEVAGVVRDAWIAQPTAASELVRPWKLLPVLPVPGEIAEMSQDPATGVWSGWLANGIRFHIRQMAARNPGGVEICATIAGSELLEDPSTRGLSEVTGRSWELLVVPGMNADQVHSLFQASNTRMQAIGLADHVRIVAATDRTFFNAYMQRLHVTLTRSEPNQQVIDFYKDGVRAQVQGVGSDLNATFVKLMSDTMYIPGEVRVRPLAAEMLDHVTPDSVRDWSRKLALCPMEIAIVGDISPEDAMEALRFYLGGLPSRPRIAADTYSSLRTNVLNPLPHVGTSRTNGPSGSSTLAIRGFYTCGPETQPDAASLRIAANILNARLTADGPRLGLPPGGQVAVNFLPEFPDVSFIFYVAQGTLDEAGVKHMNTQIANLFATFAADGPTADELAAAVDDAANEVEQNLDFPSGWWDYMSMMDYRGRTIESLANAPLTMRALTVQDIRDTFAKYYNRSNNLIELATFPSPPDDLLQFIDQPPPPPTPEQPVEDPAQPAGPEPTPPGR